MNVTTQTVGSEWYAALSLSERLKTPRHRARLAADGEQLRRGRTRLDRWDAEHRRLVGLPVASRLPVDGVSEEEVVVLLGETPMSVRARVGGTPSWLDYLIAAYSDQRSHGRITDAVDGNRLVGLLELVSPLLHKARAELRANIGRIVEAEAAVNVDIDRVDKALFLELASRILTRIARALVLELNVRRVRGALTGGTPEERFDHFVRMLRDRDEALQILRAYPVMARLVTVITRQWVAANTEMLRRLADDTHVLRRFLGLGASKAPLIDVVSLGDPHRGGRSVTRCAFGDGQSVIYKPRSLAAERHFYSLSAWVEGMGAPAPMAIATIDRRTYGWQEYVEATSCSTEPEVIRFYERLGGSLALLYLLQGTDLHFENVIAHGEYPAVVDLETVFQPRVGGVAIGSAPHAAQWLANHSVLRVGLLPNRVWTEADIEGVDLSGIGADRHQVVPHPVGDFEGVGKDSMHHVRRRAHLPHGEHRPVLDGQELDPRKFKRHVVEGFQDVYRLLERHQDALLSPGGLITAFRNDPTRVVLRATATYGALREESLHPDFLADALDREQFFDHLWVATGAAPGLKRVIASERRDLDRDDVPLFTTGPSTCDLWDSDGNVIPDFFEVPAFDEVRDRLLKFGPDDLSAQSWIIEASLATVADQPDQQVSRVRSTGESVSLVSPEEFMEAAEQVGDRICQLALTGPHDISWISLLPGPRGTLSVAPVDFDLYHGAYGIALFLAQLGDLSGERRYTEIAEAGIAAARKQIAAADACGVGAFTGLGGAIYTLVRLGVLWRSADLIQEAVALVDLLEPRIEQDSQLDLVGGAAGCLVSLVRLYEVRQIPDVLAMAMACGNHLLERAVRQVHGVGWPCRFPSATTTAPPLAGASHGAAGICWALAELWNIADRDRCLQAIRDGLIYERNLFCVHERNWQDLREGQPLGKHADHPGRFMTAWCHGAPGIGLARIAMMRAGYRDSHIEDEVRAAVERTLSSGFGGSHCLCHGDLGNLELLRQAAAALHSPALAARTGLVASEILRSIRHDGWQCGIPQGIHIPGFMTGLAGIGYGLLRCARPDVVPSVLTLSTHGDAGEGNRL